MKISWRMLLERRVFFAAGSGEISELDIGAGMAAFMGWSDDDGGRFGYSGWLSCAVWVLQVWTRVLCLSSAPRGSNCECCGEFRWDGRGGERRDGELRLVRFGARWL